MNIAAAASLPIRSPRPNVRWASYSHPIPRYCNPKSPTGGQGRTGEDAADSLMGILTQVDIPQDDLQGSRPVALHHVEGIFKSMFQVLEDELSPRYFPPLNPS